MRTHHGRIPSQNPRQVDANMVPESLPVIRSTRGRFPSSSSSSPRILAWSAVALATVGLAGCGGSGGPEMARVYGMVTYNGKPVTQGTISFQPTDPANGAPATGIIESDGSYRIQTTEPGDGARLGSYTVAIRSVSGEPDVPLDYIPRTPPPPPKSNIPERYANPASSNLTAKVERGSNQIDFKLVD
jgi:hypothetical protein